MTRTVAALLVSGLLLSSVAFAHDHDKDAKNNPIEQRQDLMKQAGKSAKAIGDMLKEKKPFDAATAMAALEAWKNSADSFGDFFPEGSETGYDTEASEEIWNDWEGFESDLADFKHAVDKAIDANPTSLAALGDAASPVFKTCKGCHEEFRVEKED